MTREIVIRQVTIGGNRPFALIAGPCVIESERTTLEAAESLKRITADLRIPFIFKSSYDKANRSSVKSYRGPGLKEGLRILARVKKSWICRSFPTFTALRRSAPQPRCSTSSRSPRSSPPDRPPRGGRQDGQGHQHQKGQFLAPWDIKNAAEKAASTGNDNILITERGVSFGYNNLVVDMRSLPIIRSLGLPVVFDATHSVQLPGAGGTASSGDRQFVSHLTRAAVAAGVDALFMEVHACPDKALCDGPNMLSLDELPALLKQAQEIDRIVK